MVAYEAVTVAVDGIDNEGSQSRFKFGRLRSNRSLRAGAVALLLSGGCSINVDSGDTSPSASPQAAATASTYIEIADRNPNLLLYKDNRGTPSDKKLTLGQEVQVECVAPNESGMTSADPGFYRLHLGDLTLYGITNMFANGDPVGQNGYNTLVDPLVPSC